MTAVTPNSPRRRRRRRWACSTLAGIILIFSATASGQSAPPVADLHVDLPYQVHVHGRRLQDSRAPTSPRRLARGHVTLMVLPLFVVDAWRHPPATVRASYEATYRDLLEAMRGGPSPPPAPPTAEAPSGIETLLAFEGADGFADDPAALIPWIARGACLVGLVHTRTNALAGSSSDPKTAARRVGLTRRGREVVRTAYTHGALADLAHASDAAVADIVDVARTFRAPLVCSHTGMRAEKAIERNVSDEQMRAIAASGGVVGVDLHSGHISRRPGRAATMEDFVRHLDHAVDVAGIEHVAIGSDLDGGIHAPEGSDGAATWPEVAMRLRRRGWTEAQLAAVFHRNAERVLSWARTRGCGGT